MAAAVKTFQHFDTPKEPGVYYRLICLTGEAKGNAYFLFGSRIVMGRSDKCDITILDLKSSREHAEIIKVGDDYIITDLGSQNGVMVNDLKIKQHSLTDGDKVIIGKTVYKFSKINVKESLIETKKKKIKKKVQVIEEEEEEEEPENKKLSLVLFGIIALGVAVIFLGDGDENNTGVPQKKSVITANVKEIDKVFSEAAKQRRKVSKENKEKLQIYFKRGLREFREENFFRAISEFENAKQFSPNDPLANFYLRKTREALDERIESYFSKAIRDGDALNYQKSAVSYCGIIRLLANYTNDSRYISAKEGVKNIEEKLGLDEGEINCVEIEAGSK